MACRRFDCANSKQSHLLPTLCQKFKRICVEAFRDDDFEELFSRNDRLRGCAINDAIARNDAAVGSEWIARIRKFERIAQRSRLL